MLITLHYFSIVKTLKQCIKHALIYYNYAKVMQSKKGQDLYKSVISEGKTLSRGTNECMEM